MTTFATRRISQETFDAVVRENVEDFDMDAAEAVREAREQFEHQGVDLTGVDVSGSEERKAERAALVADVALVKKAAAGGVARPDLLEALARAATLCSAGRGRAAASARSTIVAAQGLSALARLARSCVDEATDAVGDAGVLAATLAALDRAVRGDADARDAFQYGGCVEATVAALKAGVKTDAAAAAAALRVAAAAARQCEAVKAAFMRLKLARLAVEALVTAAAARDEAGAGAAAQALAALCAADDVRSATSCTYDASRLALDAGAVHALLAALEAFADAEGGEDAATAALDALRQVAKSDDAVKRIREAGGARACLDALRRNRTRRDRCRRLVGLLRNMANNDDAKDAMCKDGTLEEILGCLERFLRDDAVICEHVVATLAMMALRRPKNGTLIVEGRNGASLVIHAMGAHPAHAALQRQGALALRNFVARSPEFKQPILDAGAETALRAAATCAQANVDVAYAALRDLGVDAKIATFETDASGAVVQSAGPARFGDKANANFKAVFDESADVERRIHDVDALTDQQTKLEEFSLM